MAVTLGSSRCGRTLGQRLEQHAEGAQLLVETKIAALSMTQGRGEVLAVGSQPRQMGLLRMVFL